MTVASTIPIAVRVSGQEAREELSKFFVIADLAEKAPGMFSAYIDAEWHRLAQTADYSAFCMMSVGHQVTHEPINGEGNVEWLDLYHERFGALPPTWFADHDGNLDTDAYHRYLDTRAVTASWNCQPGGGDPDATPSK